MPEICLCLTAPTMKENYAHIAAYRSYIDLVELRVDLLDPDERTQLQRNPDNVVRSFGDLRSILTVRRQQDGGAWTGTEGERLSLVRALLPGGFSWVDVEADPKGFEQRQVLVREARAQGSRIIASRHYLEGVPADLSHELVRLLDIGDCAKVAAKPNGVSGVLQLLRAGRSCAGPHVVVGMGSYGVPTRLMSSVLANLFTFTSPASSTQAASGHISPDTLHDLYAHASCGQETRYFAVVGNPIAHSRSPEYHNTRFRQDGFDAVYVPFRVDDFSSFMDLACELPLQGISVTVPHKEAAARCAAHVDDGVSATSACNTLIRRDDGAYDGVNTDIEGLLRPLEGLLEGISAAMVLGAGGAARAAVFALMTRGIPVRVCNRTRSRAETLVSDLNALCERRGVRFVPAVADDLPGTGDGTEEPPDLIVQTTSVGMHPDIDGDPIPAYRFRGSETVYDVIYTPPMTALLRRAETAGCRTINGSGMFDAQAAAQYRLFTNVLSYKGGSYGNSEGTEDICH